MFLLRICGCFEFERGLVCGLARKAFLLKKLVLTCMQEEVNLKKHRGEFFGTVKTLKEINLVVVDELLAILLLYNLSDSFSMLPTAMESQDEFPATGILKIEIIENYEGRKSRDVNTDQGAMYVKKQQGTQKQKKSNQKPIKNPIIYQLSIIIKPKIKLSQ